MSEIKFDIKVAQWDAIQELLVQLLAQGAQLMAKVDDLKARVTEIEGAMGEVGSSLENIAADIDRIKADLAGGVSATEAVELQARLDTLSSGVRTVADRASAIAAATPEPEPPPA